MKKEMMAMVNSDEGTFRLNSYLSLRKFTKNGLGDKCDMLKLEFGTVPGLPISAGKEIKSRDYDGIIEEVQELTKQHFNDMADDMCRKLQGGLRRVSDGE